MALPTPPAYTTPIPNNPFYSNPSYIIEGAYYPFVVGSGLSVSPDGIISASGSGGGAVASVTGGAGISVAPATGNVVVTNTGVTNLIAGAGIAVTANTGSIVISSTASAGTVTTVNSGTGLTGGPIVSTGTLAIANTGVVAATYTNPTLAINAQGQITSASNGTSVTSVSGSLPITVTPGATPTVAINAASTTNCGAVLLSDSTTSTSSTEAATSLAVKTAYDAAIAAIPKACVTAKGTLVTGTAASIPVALPVGADGLVLTACAACTEGLFWAAGGGGSVPSATPTVEGIVFGCTDAANSNYGLGNNILSALTTGTFNIAIGTGALAATDTGTSNTAVGIGALFTNTSGTQNVALGQQALFLNTTDGLNTAIGSQALQNTTGGANTALGNFAGNLVTTGCNNILIGNQSGGAGAGALNTGCDNVIIGNCLSVASSSGNCQLAIGTTTFCWLSGTSTGAIQPGAGIIDCAGSCGTAGQILSSDGANAIEWIAAPSAASPATSTVFGTVKGFTIDNSNTGYGCFAGCSLTPNCRTTVVGVRAGCALTTGDANTVLGNNAMCAVTTGCFNVALGERSMQRAGATAQANVAIGVVALEDVTGACNTGVGTEAGLQMLGGNSNVFIGPAAARDNTSGSRNVVIGPDTTTSALTVSCELVIGYNAGQNWLTGDSTKAIKPGAGIVDSTNSCGTANMVLTSQGNAVEWKSVNSALAVPNYGSFIDTTTQSVTSVTNPQPVTLNTTVASANFSIVSGSQVTAAVAGTYNLQFSIQLETTTASLSNVEIWLAKNGTAVVDSNTRFITKGSGEAAFAALNYVESLAAGDYLELIWASDDANMQMITAPSLFGGPRIPSVILTIVPVGA